MLGPLPLPHLLAAIWDGQVLATDLVSQDESPWVAAADYSELSQAFHRAAAGGQSSAPELPAAAPDLFTSTPAPQGGSPLTPPPGAGPLLTPPPAGDDDGEEAATQVVSVSAFLPQLEQLAQEAPAATPAPAAVPERRSPSGRHPSMGRRDSGRQALRGGAEAPVFEGKLEARALASVLGRVLRQKLTGTLTLQGPYRLTLQFAGGAAVAASGSPLASGAAQRTAQTLGLDPAALAQAASNDPSDLAAALEAAGALEPRRRTQFLSLYAFEQALSAFTWRGGRYAFHASEVPDKPAFHLNAYALLRAGLATGYELAELSNQVAGWCSAALQPGNPSTAPDPNSLHLDERELALLKLVDKGPPFRELVRRATDELGLSERSALCFLYGAYNVGLVTIAASAAGTSAGVLEPSVPLRTVLQADYFELLGLARTPGPLEPSAVDTAFRAARERASALPLPPEQLRHVLTRLERAHHCLGSEQLRSIYLEQGEEAALQAANPEARSDTPGGIHIRAQPEQRLRTAAGPGGAAAASKAATPAPDGRPGARSRTPRVRGRTPMPRGSSGGHKLEELQAKNFEKAQVLIDSKKYKEAQTILRQLVKVDPTDGRLHAHLAWAAYMATRRKEADRKDALRSLELALRMDRRQACTYYFMGKVFQDSGARQKARGAMAKAVELDPTFGNARATLGRLRKKGNDLGDDRGKVQLAVGAFVLLFGVLFYVANYLGHDPAAAVDGFGAQEYYYHPTAWFFYVRRVLVLALGAIGSYAVFRYRKGRAVAGWSVAGIIFGLLLGYLSHTMYAMRFPRGEVPPVYLAMLLVALHAVADEHFFRGFLQRSLMPYFGRALPAALAAGVVYGLYHLSYVSFWWGLHFFHPGRLLGSMPIQVISLTVTMGVPLGLLYAKSRSVVPGILAQVAFGWIYIVLSIMQGQGG